LSESALVKDRISRPNEKNPIAAAQHAHPADRFAREILAILECVTMRSQRLMRNPFGVRGAWAASLF
jgi:hypothetical protein